MPDGVGRRADILRKTLIAQGRSRPAAQKADEKVHGTQLPDTFVDKDVLPDQFIEVVAVPASSLRSILGKEGLGETSSFEKVRQVPRFSCFVSWTPFR